MFLSGEGRGTVNASDSYKNNLTEGKIKFLSIVSLLVRTPSVTSFPPRSFSVLQRATFSPSMMLGLIDSIGCRLTTGRASVKFGRSVRPVLRAAPNQIREGISHDSLSVGFHSSSSSSCDGSLPRSSYLRNSNRSYSRCCVLL